MVKPFRANSIVHGAVNSDSWVRKMMEMAGALRIHDVEDN